MKEQVNLKGFLAVLLSLVLVATEGILLYFIWKITGSATLFKLAASGVVLAVMTIVLLLLPWKSWKGKTFAFVLRAIAVVLAFLLLIPSFWGIFAVTKLQNTFEAITSTSTVSSQVGVYVLTDDPAQTIEDAKDYLFGITPSYDAKNTNKTLDEMAALYQAAPATQEYDKVISMITGLYVGDVQAMVLNTAYITLLEGVEDFGDFADKTRLLKEYTIVTEAEPTEPAPTGHLDPANPTHPDDPVLPTTEVVDPLYQPFAVYLSGSDTRTSTLAPARSDVNIIAVVNPGTKQILLINTPRDYFIPTAASEVGSCDKLAHCGVWGIECSMNTLSNYYGIPIKYYAQINFTGFETLIDSIGGVTIYSEEGDGVHLEPGANYMDGETALNFARDRYSYADGDNARGRHQMQVITAVVDKLTGGSLITNYSQIMDSLQGMFVTSVPNETISAYIKMQLADMAHWDVYSFPVTGYGGYDQPYSMGGLFAWVMYPYEDSVWHAVDLMNRMLRGEKLTAADIPMP